MPGDILIDKRGRALAGGPWAGAPRIDPDPAGDITVSAVRKGYIHLRRHGSAIRVSLGAREVGAPALAGALYAIHEHAPERIMVSVLSPEGWKHRLCASVSDFAHAAESIISEATGEPTTPWFAVDRDLRVLSAPRFASVRPLVQLWMEQRGEAIDDLRPHLDALGMTDRVILARQRSGSSRLVIEHFGAGIRMLRPCESLLALGRDVDDVPDRAYGAWVADSYAAAIAEEKISVSSVRATIRTWEVPEARVHYDRLLMPWRDRSDKLVLSVSLRRAFSLTA